MYPSRPSFVTGFMIVSQTAEIDVKKLKIATKLQTQQKIAIKFSHFAVVNAFGYDLSVRSLMKVHSLLWYLHSMIFPCSSFRFLVYFILANGWSSEPT